MDLNHRTMTQKELMNLFTLAGSVANSDQFLLYSAGTGSTVKVTAEILRTYLNKDFTLTVSDQGTLVIGGVDTGRNIAGITPLLRRGTESIEVSYDNGSTYTVLVTYADIGLDPEVISSQIGLLKLNKADKSDLEALQETVASKADAEDLSHLQEDVDAKAEVSDLEALSSRLDGLSIKKPMTEDEWAGISSNPANLQPDTIYMTFET